MVQVGDAVVFPQAPYKGNQNRRYVVTEVTGDGLVVETDDEDRFSYSIPYEKCARFGMTVVS